MRGVARALGLAALGLALSALVAGGTAAKPSGAGPGPPSGNKEGAKACQKGGYDELYRSAADGGTGFDSEQECTSYAARGGTLTTTPPPTPQSVCEGAGGTFTDETLANFFACDGTLPPASLTALSVFCDNLDGVTSTITDGPDQMWCAKR